MAGAAECKQAGAGAGAATHSASVPAQILPDWAASTHANDGPRPAELGSRALPIMRVADLLRLATQAGRPEWEFLAAGGSAALPPALIDRSGADATDGLQVAAGGCQRYG